MRAVLIGGAAGAVLVGLQVCGVWGAEAGGTGASRFEATLKRPLFSPTRRPPPPPMVAAVMPFQPMPPAAAVPPAPPPDVALSGVIIGGRGGVALLRRSQDVAPARVALGGQVDGWTLAEIRPRAVVLKRDGRSVTVELPAPAPSGPRDPGL